MSNKIVDIYKSILACGGMITDSEGFISVRMNTASEPAVIDGKRLVLPTQNQLMNPDRTNRIVFHPLAENILRGESDVISKLRSVFNIRLNYTFAAIGQNLLQIAASVTDHKKLTPDQSEILSIVKDVDDKTVIAFTSLMLNAMKQSADKCFINIYLKRKATIDGKVYSRGGVVTFPVLSELLKDQDSYFGVKLRVKDRNAFIQLHEYLLPNLKLDGHYNRASNSDVAPYLDALMHAVMSVGSKFNDVLDLFGDLLDAKEDLVFDSDWVEPFENLAALLPQIRQIPMQAGNEGKGNGSEIAQAPIAPISAPAPITYNTPAPVAPPQMMQPVYASQMQAPQPNAYGGHPMHYPQQQQPMAPPPVVVTEKGINFESFLRNNPALAANVMMSAPNTGQFQQPMQQMPANPRWANAPQQNVYGNNPNMNQQGFYQSGPSNMLGRGIV